MITYHIHTTHIHTTYTQNCGDSILCHTVPRLVRPDPRVRQRIYTSLTCSLDVFRSRRMDHTVSHKWLIKQTIHIRFWPVSNLCTQKSICIPCFLTGDHFFFLDCFYCLFLYLYTWRTCVYIQCVYIQKQTSMCIHTKTNNFFWRVIIFFSWIVCYREYIYVGVGSMKD